MSRATSIKNHSCRGCGATSTAVYGCGTCHELQTSDPTVLAAAGKMSRATSNNACSCRGCGATSTAACSCRKGLLAAVRQPLATGAPSPALPIVSAPSPLSALSSTIDATCLRNPGNSLPVYLLPGNPFAVDRMEPTEEVVLEAVVEVVGGPLPVPLLAPPLGLCNAKTTMYP